MNAATLLVYLVIAATPENPTMGGVIVPDGGFGNRSRVVVGGVLAAAASTQPRAFSDVIQGALGSPPQSDKEKWWLIIYADLLQNEASKLLARDLENDRDLRSIASWCKTFVIDKNSSPAAEARVQAGMAIDQGGVLPVILLVPNPNDPVFGADPNPKNWQYAFQSNGYGGDAGLLARSLWNGIKRHYESRGQPCPGPNCPVNPNPRPGPAPQPGPAPNLPPDDGWNPVTPPPGPADPQPADPALPTVPGWWSFLTFYFPHIVLVGLIVYWIARSKGLKITWDTPPRQPSPPSPEPEKKP